MSNLVVENPFDADPVEEVHLPRAPLVHVVAQVRFPLILALATEAGLAPLQALLSRDYPVLHLDSTVGVLLTSDGVTTQPQSEKVWRLQTKDNDWQISVGTTFFSLDTTAYTSRSDFCERFKGVLTTFSGIFEPVIAERVGMRYVDRVDDPALLARLSEFVRPEILGGHGVPLPDGVTLKHSVCESLFEGDESRLLARWGVLPANAVLDPLIVPTDRRAWVLDVDVFQSDRVDFDVSALTERVRSYADQSYRFFRWAVTDALLEEFGGKV